MQDLKIKLRKIQRRHCLNNYIPAAVNILQINQINNARTGSFSTALEQFEQKLIGLIVQIDWVDSLHRCLSQLDWRTKEN